LQFFWRIFFFGAALFRLIWKPKFIKTQNKIKQKAIIKTFYLPSYNRFKINCIHNNPLEAMLVRNPEDWIYSSASNYLNGYGILKEIHCLIPSLRRVK